VIRARPLSTRICILTTTWNRVSKTLQCLESVFAQDCSAFSVLLVDNGSTDGTVQLVTEYFPEVSVIALPRNIGFAAAYNVGLRWALEENFQFIFLINNDTILAPDCLSRLLQEAEAADSIALVTAKIYFESEPDRIWSVGGRLSPWTLEIVDKGDNQLDQGQWSTARDIDFAPLCGVLIDGHALKTIGLLDEGYFVYYEDMDFCRKARLAGFRLRLAPDAHMWHAVSASSGGRHSPMERYWMAQSSGRYFRLHGRGWRLFVIIPYRLGSAIRTSGKLLFRVNLRSLAAYWLGLARGWLTGRATHPPPGWVVRNEA
jgi:GT2 family glycosyltransferase